MTSTSHRWRKSVSERYRGTLHGVAFYEVSYRTGAKGREACDLVARFEGQEYIVAKRHGHFVSAGQFDRIAQGVRRHAGFASDQEETR